MLKHTIGGGPALGIKKNAMAHAVTIDPFSRLCQLHTAGSNNIKVVGDEFSMQYILGLRAIAKDVFHEEISSISKAVYEEVTFRVASGNQTKIQPYHSSQQMDGIEQIEEAITSSLELQKSNFIDPLYEKLAKNESVITAVDSKLRKFDRLEEIIEELLKREPQSVDKSSDSHAEEIEGIQAELETLKSEFAERGNLYIKLCEELESDRLDNKLMKEELESEFNIIQDQFENFEKNIQEQINGQINEHVDFFVDSLKNDIKSVRNEVEQDREDAENFVKRKFEDLKKRIESENEDFDDRLSRAIKEQNLRYQGLVEKLEMDTTELNSKIKKLDSKIEVISSFILSRHH
jgi:hypothetical protein